LIIDEGKDAAIIIFIVADIRDKKQLGVKSNKREAKYMP